MRFFAEINAQGTPDEGRVRLVFTHVPDFDPEYAEGTVAAINVTDMSPQPEAGWVYSFNAGTFTPPPEPVVVEDEIDNENGD